jgi:hypothetical protein
VNASEPPRDPHHRRMELLAVIAVVIGFLTLIVSTIRHS